MITASEHRYRQWVDYQREIDDICAPLSPHARQRLFWLWRESLRLGQRQLIAPPRWLRPIHSTYHFLSVGALLPVAVFAIVALWRFATDLFAGDWEAMGDHALFYVVAVAVPVLIRSWYQLGRDTIVEEQHASLGFADARRLEAHLGTLPSDYWR